MVRVDDADNRDAQFLRFGDRDLLIADVDDEKRVGQRVHLLDAAEAAVELVHLALQGQRLALAHLFEGSILPHRFEILQALDRHLDRLEVRQHAAEPAVVDVGHSRPLSFFGDDVTRLALGADEEDGAAVHGQLAHVFDRLLVHRHRLFQIDDVNLVALAEDIVLHLRIPVTGLVGEMHSGFQHLTHCHRHH